MHEPSSARSLDQRREKLSSLSVTLLSPSFSDTPPHLVILGGSQVALLLAFCKTGVYCCFTTAVFSAFTSYCRDFLECKGVSSVSTT